MIHLQLLTSLLKKKKTQRTLFFFFPSPHAVIWTVYWQQLEATAHPTFHKSWGDSAQRLPEKHMQEKMWYREDGTRGNGGGEASADKTEGRKSEVMSDVLLADFFE